MKPTINPKKPQDPTNITSHLTLLKKGRMTASFQSGESGVTFCTAEHSRKPGNAALAHIIIIITIIIATPPTQKQSQPKGSNLLIAITSHRGSEWEKKVTRYVALFIIRAYDIIRISPFTEFSEESGEREVGDGEEGQQLSDIKLKCPNTGSWGQKTSAQPKNPRHALEPI